MRHVRHPGRSWSGFTAVVSSTAAPISTTRSGSPLAATSSSSRSTIGSGPWAFWHIPRWPAKPVRTPATTGLPTSRRLCGGCATISPDSVATRPRSPLRGSPPAPYRCVTISSHRSRTGCSGQPSCRAARVRPKPHCPPRSESASTTRPKKVAATRFQLRNACAVCLSIVSGMGRHTSGSAPTF